VAPWLVWSGWISHPQRTKWGWPKLTPKALGVARPPIFGPWVGSATPKGQTLNLPLSLSLSLSLSLWPCEGGWTIPMGYRGDSATPHAKWGWLSHLQGSWGGFQPLLFCSLGVAESPPRVMGMVWPTTVLDKMGVAGHSHCPKFGPKGWLE